MKWFVFFISVLHGLIHLLGFVKGMQWADVKELSIPVSKIMGIGWLLTAILLFAFAGLYIAGSRHAWIFGLMAIAVSQFLIIRFWNDAKFGTIPNAFLFLVVLFLTSSCAFQKMIDRETNEMLRLNSTQHIQIISEKEIESLPLPVQKWLYHSGIVGKQAIRAGQIYQKAEMKMKPEQKEWISATALQYTTTTPHAFIWTVEAKMNPFIWFTGRDKFENGKGHMLIKINTLLAIVNEQGHKLDEGTIQRYLGEMVWLPSLALSKDIVWQPINDTLAKATMKYMGTEGSGFFHFNADGDVIQFSAFRYKGNDTDAERYEWIMQIHDYGVFEGIRVPTKMTATWKLPEGDWTWLKLEVTKIFYNDNIKHSTH